jgi:hypothetical protein
MFPERRRAARYRQRLELTGHRALASETAPRAGHLAVRAGLQRQRVRGQRGDSVIFEQVVRAGHAISQELDAHVAGVIGLFDQTEQTQVRPQAGKQRHPLAAGAFHDDFEIGTAVRGRVIRIGAGRRRDRRAAAAALRQRERVAAIGQAGDAGGNRQQQQQQL